MEGYLATTVSECAMHDFQQKYQSITKRTNIKQTAFFYSVCIGTDNQMRYGIMANANIRGLVHLNDPCFVDVMDPDFACGGDAGIRY